MDLKRAVNSALSRSTGYELRRTGRRPRGRGRAVGRPAAGDRLVQASGGKPLIVEKTPNTVFIAERIKECWPDARFIFLLRHPGAIARSRAAYKRDGDEEANVDLIRRYC